MVTVYSSGKQYMIRNFIFTVLATYHWTIVLSLFHGIQQSIATSSTRARFPHVFSQIGSCVGLPCAGGENNKNLWSEKINKNNEKHPMLLALQR